MLRAWERSLWGSPPNRDVSVPSRSKIVKYASRVIKVRFSQILLSSIQFTACIEIIRAFSSFFALFSFRPYRFAPGQRANPIPPWGSAFLFTTYAKAAPSFGAAVGYASALCAHLCRSARASARRGQPFNPCNSPRRAATSPSNTMPCQPSLRAASMLAGLSSINRHSSGLSP